jgi:hypothetical protein
MNSPLQDSYDGENAQPEKVIYILGGGHSGSTLLDMVLGSTEQSFSVGELTYFDYYKGYKHENLYRLVDGRLCTCDEQMDDCPIWSKINFDQKDNVPKHESLSESLKILVNLFNPFERWFRFGIETGNNREVYKRIFAEALQQKPKLRFIVDSSKDPRRLYELIRDPKIGPERLAVIHLIRDGRGYIYSYQKKERLQDGRERSGRALRGTWICLVEWIIVNLISRRLLRKFRINAYTMSYDRFAENPDQGLEDLGHFLGYDLGADTVIERINQTTYHNIHGNPIRQSKLTGIRRDVKWRTFFSPLKRTVLSIILYPFNRRWVYPRQ